MDLGRRVELDWLFDFYGALLTPRRQEIVRLRCEEDMTLAELGEAMGISRQAAADALAHAEGALRGYEEKLGLLAKWREALRAAAECEEALGRLEKGDEKALSDARKALGVLLETKG